MSQSTARQLLTPRKGYEFWKADFWFGQIDSRPLSVFRIALALLLLKDAIYHLPLARDFYSDDGIVPRSALTDGLARSWRFSLMDAMPYPWMATLFFVLWIAVLVLLLAGYRSKLMSILNLIILVSIHERDVYVLSGADTVFRVLSIWSVFIPLGHHYSVDALLKRLHRYRGSHAPADLRVEDGPKTAWAFPVRMIQIQFVLIYVFTGLLKIIEPSSWRTGEAVYYAMQIKSLTLPTGDWVEANAPMWLLKIVDYHTLLVELGFTIFMFSPFFQPYLKIGGLALGALLHLGIAVLMAIANFSPVMIASYLLFFEPGWIEWLDLKLRRLRPEQLPSRIGVPPRDSPLYLLLAATRADELELAWGVTQGQTFDSWTIGDETGGTLSGQDAWLRAAGHLPLSRLWGWTLRSAAIRRAAWNGLSAPAARALIPLPDPEAEPLPQTIPPGRALRVTMRLARGALAAGLGLLMGGVIWWNLAGMQVQNKPIFPATPDAVATAIDYPGLWQGWSMFAPFPQNYDGWIVIPGKFEDGKTFDLRTGEPVVNVMPRSYLGFTDRWKKFEDNLERERYQPILFAWAAMYCREYNTEQNLPDGHRLATLEIVYKVIHSHDPGQVSGPASDILLWKHWCYAKYQY